jgi:hypothetical protein
MAVLERSVAKPGAGEPSGSEGGVVAGLPPAAVASRQSIQANHVLRPSAADLSLSSTEPLERRSGRRRPADESWNYDTCRPRAVHSHLRNCPTRSTAERLGASLGRLGWEVCAPKLGKGRGISTALARCAPGRSRARLLSVGLIDRPLLFLPSTGAIIVSIAVRCCPTAC